ncbi:MAG: hypothetical protein C4574_02920 [Candidatus Latescibacterota bacterium]|jgi:uncharacterized protein YciI|nr:MAG: hypothetical protein C4574_02920 [Candidatus Latescibacterota bacterium]
MKIALFVLLAGAALLAATGFTAEAGTVPADDEMETYYVGLIYRGPAWTPDETPEIAALQEAHLANIRRLADSGKLVLAGPFIDGGELRGMFVFRVETLDEAAALCDSDPAVRAGRLRVELHPWYSAKGIGIAPRAGGEAQ